MKVFAVSFAIGIALALNALADEPAPPAKVTVIPFNDAIERIIQRSTAVATQRATLETTYARNLANRGVFLPRLDFDLTQFRIGANDGSGYEIPTSTTRAAHFTASLNLFRFGADGFLWAAANDEEQAQISALEAAVLTTEDSAVETLVQRIRGGLEVGIRTRVLAIREQSVKLAYERYKRGLIPREEAQRLEIDAENTRAILRGVEAFTAEARARLAALLGPDFDVEIAYPWRDRLTKPEARALAGSALRVEDRPDWRSARSFVEANYSRGRRSVSLLLPSLDASYSHGWQEPSGNPVATSWNAALKLSIPLFERLENYSSYRVQKFTTAASEIALESTAREALSQWAGARRRFEVELESALIRERTLQMARELYQVTLNGYRRGQVNSNDLSTDQDRVAEAEFLVAQGWSEAHTAYSRLCHALGRRLSGCP